MLGRLIQILLCFLIAMQPPSKSLFAEIYHRIGDTGQPALITLVDNAVAELANVARNVDAVDEGLISPNFSGAFVEYELPNILHDLASNKTDHENVDPLEETKNELEHGETNVTVPETPVDEKIVVSADPISIVPSNDTSADPSKAVDEKPHEDIPSFSEWAQKQLEEAEKNKEVAQNDSSQSPHKAAPSAANLRIRSKNYASPDCGAKIVAVNPEAGSASFILSSSRDEYMLNTCTSRIWFVVELCEAIQAKKIELANFELFSSTPKNFSVHVSDRFPTREWAGVGQFVARDERDVQVFNLHPHLFGKFIRVELHSHHGAEHYCPISLFRAYGTSEFDVLETENSQVNSHDGDDDDDDDDAIQNMVDPDKKGGDASKNLFGSARDAVMSIMKKAAEALVKSSDSNNASMQVNTVLINNEKCQSPSHVIVCENCTNAFFSEVYDLMSCESDYLKTIVDSPLVHKVLCNSNMCQAYGLEFATKEVTIKTDIADYISALLMPGYVAALCNMLAIVEKKVVLNTSYETDLNITSNLTIDKKATSAINGGMLDALLQEPFNVCNGNSENCKIEVPINDKTSEGNIELPQSHEHETSSMLNINPTKTTQIDVNVETTILDSQFPVNPNTDNSVIGSVDSVKSGEAENVSTNHDQQLKENSYTESSNVSDGMANIDQDKSNITNTSLQQGDTSNSQASSTSVNGETSNSSQEQLGMDGLLNEFEPGSDFSTPAPTQNSVTMPSVGQGQKESVFLRLSNRIKALEKNMSLSGQYLEELSRRYKKQVEEMQKTFEKTLLTINEESKKAEQREHKYTEEMVVLQQQIAQLSIAMSLLLAERDSWFGGLSIVKIILSQILVTVIIVYIYKRNASYSNAFSGNVPRDSNNVLDNSKSEVRRNSVAGGVVHFSEADCVSNKRRLSGEVLSHSTDISSLSISKGDKKKRKRKTSILHRRSVSMVEEVQPNLNSIKTEWPSAIDIDNPIALEEAEFVGPDTEPIDFSKMGEMKPNEVTPKKEFPKTNGSILGLKMMLGKNSEKERRLSSPAFFKAPNLKNLKTDEQAASYSQSSSPVFHRNVSDMQPLDLSCQSSSSHISEWPSAGQLSQTSQASMSNISTSSKGKKSKKTSFKNMLKSVLRQPESNPKLLNAVSK